MKKYAKVKLIVWGVLGLFLLIAYILSSIGIRDDVRIEEHKALVSVKE